MPALVGLLAERHRHGHHARAAAARLDAGECAACDASCNLAGVLGRGRDMAVRECSYADVLAGWRQVDSGAAKGGTVVVDTGRADCGTGRGRVVSAWRPRRIAA